MTYAEEKALREKRLFELSSMSDSEKLEYAISLLVDSIEIDMLTDSSDTHGIDYTNEWYAHEDKKEEFLLALKRY